MAHQGAKGTLLVGLLDFPDPLQHLQTKQLDLAPVTKALSSRVAPPFFDNLNFQRAAVCGWLQNSSKAVTAEILEGLKHWSAHCHGLADLAVEVPQFRSEWCSTLLASRGSRLLVTLLSFRQELAMVYWTRAVATRQLALQKAQQAFSKDPAAATSAPPPAAEPSVTPSVPLQPDTDFGEQPGAGSAPDEAQHLGLLTAAVTLLRKAAGLFAYMADTLLAGPGTAGGGPGAEGSCRLAELHPSTCRFMYTACLAEAAALTAARASEKGSSPGTLAALHAGCLNFFTIAERQADDASRVLRDAGTPGLADGVRRWLGASAALHGGAARYCMALDWADKMECGQAEACCLDAESSLDTAAKSAGSEAAWKRAILELREAVAGLRQKVSKDRLTVTYQPLPNPGPPMTTGKMLVSALEFTPHPAVPNAPAPLIEQKIQQNCAVM